ncbi:hypothetical protein [Solirubrum puertoriconensis]|uniref:Glycoside hydrolase family 65 n=1 Tax=Solirubrum puertoriconensis TaxID=1751427 RepID=A0A9X0HNG8_SOLP1|nr:hypothetical protein [Solirubrum puertoriconensis]KUG09132.1 hypothetical protein ASU33_20150 [Solirubrum puertoriconensis]
MFPNRLFLSLLGLGAVALTSTQGLAQAINRQAVVERHKVLNTRTDSLSSLTVGNGAFAFTTDITGLQSFPEYYQKGVPLGTQSEWGWHSFPNTQNYQVEEAQRTYDLNGRKIPYTVQVKAPERNKGAVDFLRANPHRLQLGNLGFVLLKKDGSRATIKDLRDIRQELNPWTGEIRSHFTLEGTPVDVLTVGHQEQDLVAVQVKSPLLRQQRLKVALRLPYPTAEWTDEGVNYQHADKHTSRIESQKGKGAVVSHRLDNDQYFVSFGWSGDAKLAQGQPHEFVLTPGGKQDVLELGTRFASRDLGAVPTFADAQKNSQSKWKAFWQSGGAIDFGATADPRAKELERRMILSQYLIRSQETGQFPPQETGLTYNSWFGKPHLEMHWWHAMHYGLWGRTELLEKSLDWYLRPEIVAGAKAIAQRQGFEGVRWQKMTDNEGREAPSSVGAFLIWQQPHFIHMAELVRRDRNTAAVQKKYQDLVFATADFMASYPFYEKEKDRFILGKGLIPAQERFKAEETFNPTYELVYWNWALNTAQEWRKRAGLPRNQKWDAVLQKLSKLPEAGGVYLATESATDSYTNPEFKTDHPSVLGALGMMPVTGQQDANTMRRTFDLVWKDWTWNHTWGWDFPMTSMTATRLGLPDKAVDALLMPIRTNTYLPNGHNFQDDRLRVYLPGNGGLLAAVALMCAGYDGNKTPNPGIPTGWTVKWEGLKPMP